MSHPSMHPARLTSEEQAVVAQFFARYLADCEGDGPRPADEYIQAFTGYEGLIERELALLDRGSADTRKDETRAPEHVSEAQAAVYHDHARGLLQDLSTYVKRFPDAAVEVAVALGDCVTTNPSAGRLPTQLGPYRLLHEIGRGGQAVVHLAHDLENDREVALKVLTASALARDARARFAREARATNRLEHPSIATFYDLGTDGPYTFIAMEFIRGTTLGHILRRIQRQARPSHTWLAEQLGSSEAQTWRPVVRLFEPLARALHAAHAAGIIHRDVKPGNIMVDSQGLPTLLDFGLAHDSELVGETLTRSGDLMGTPRYMSPEQVTARTRTVDLRTDIYSLGVVLFETLSGTVALHGKRLEDVRESILREPLPPLRRLRPDVPAALEVIVARATQKSPEQRYATAQELAEDLRRVGNGEPIHARPIGLTQRLLQAARYRHREARLALVLIATGLLASGAGAYWTERKSREGEAERSRIREANSLHADRIRRAVEAIAASDALTASRELGATAEDIRGFEYHYLERQLLQADQPTWRFASPPRLQWPEASRPLIFGMVGSELEVWNAKTNLVEQRIALPSGSSHVGTSGDGSTVGITYNDSQGRQALFWDVATGAQSKPIPIGPSTRPTLAWDGAWAAILSPDHELQLHHLESGHRVHLADSIEGRVAGWTYFEFDRTGERLFVKRTFNGRANRLDAFRLPDTPGLLQLDELEASAMLEQDCVGPEFVQLPAAGLLTTRTPDGLDFLDWSSFEFIGHMPIDGEMTIGPTIHPDGVHLITRHARELRVWTLPEFAQTGAPTEAGPEVGVRLLHGSDRLEIAVARTLNNLELSPDGRACLAACGDGRTVLLDLGGEQPSTDPELQAIRQSLAASAAADPLRALTQDARRIAVYTSSGQIQILDNFEQRVLLSIEAPGVVQLAFCPDGQHLATLDSDGQWQLR